MAYTVVPTVKTGDLWTAANHNAYLKDNFVAGVPDILTTIGDLAAGSGSDTVVRKGIGSNYQALAAKASDASGLEYNYGLARIGMIILWYGAIVDIPTGWSLCNGSGGTPDLRDKFVVGAGSTYAVGATGGATTHTHTQGSTGNESSHTHTQGNAGAEASHTHVLAAVETGTPSGVADALNVDSSFNNYALYSHVHDTGAPVSGTGSSHLHSNPTTAAGSAHNHTNPTTESGSNLPPYKALAYIMRTS